MTLRIAAILYIAIAFIVVACGGWGQGSDPSKETPVVGVTEVFMDDFAFAPANIVVDVGTTVTWTNLDSDRHPVTSDDGDVLVLDSEGLGEDETFSHTFDTPGEYNYYCKPHSNMHGRVTVRPVS